MVTARRLRLSRAMRLQRSGEFAALRQTGRRRSRGCLIANWQVLPDQGHSRIGVVTSRRVGPATVRNRARRLLREAFRRHQWELAKPTTLVLVARPSIAGKSYAEVERDLLGFLRDNHLLRKTT